MCWLLVFFLMRFKGEKMVEEAYKLVADVTRSCVGIRVSPAMDS